MTENRRDFLKKMFGLSVLAAACPHDIIAKLEPDIDKKGDKLLATWRISLDSFPQLKELWGFIRIKVPNTDGYFPKVLIIRIPEEVYGKKYVCLEERCPHEGYIVNDPHPVTHQIRCNNHGTMFNPDGTYISGPAAEDLAGYEVQELNDGFISMFIPAVMSDVSKVNEEESIYYIKQNYPNPCDANTMIEYGLEKSANVKIELFSVDGVAVRTLYNDFSAAGHFTLNVPTSGLYSGTYIYTMKVNDTVLYKKKLIVQR
eukprot:Anaeramoba_ignava/a479272_36.p1 GENE.a479272_36~~a479272_36.p1  ORF type:complete len:258 (+),score=-14.44 a479272_36:26-799(+)